MYVNYNSIEIKYNTNLKNLGPCIYPYVCEWMYQYLDTHMEFAYVYSKLIIVCAHVLSLVWLFATPQTLGLQAPLSVEFSRQEY